MWTLPSVCARPFRVVAVAALVSLLAACASVGGSGGRGRVPERAAPVVTDPAPIVSGTMRRYQIRGRWYQPAEQPDYDVVGLASWYGDQFHGRPTATGERFDMHALTAAHKTLPLPGLVEVTNLANGRTVILRVNDRGPFVDNRIIDLSRGAADALDLRARGVGEVRVRYLGRAPRLGGGQVLQRAAVREAAPVAPVPPPAAGGPPVWLQVAAFDTRAEAEAAAGRVGAPALVQAASNQRGYRILLGPWTDPNAAERARQGVVERGFADAALIPGG
ncbi:MAG: septal ring lytic transglycosylase RlpA family protein [Brevundimonas sp.]|uniref:septal ring lytic transglycosylase RlpA family protein n=1 Tax=Brevundimonas sp. TaxID=1871086 RepID=UPI0027363FDD|nr:septal ring lytic transglycosylase RlpA family protein [Brevundimonas sp.]MDP3403068.1 septal ring lytic transglycosylase RlpA family protein [Brevundimonas sp.]